MILNQKNILAIHDISCFGKCSLTIALPVISATGIAVSVIPTAVLSTHTGGFTGYTYRDLTADILPITDHWQTLSLGFDAIYTGYLGSERQLDIVAELAKRFKTKKSLMIIDPVMADNGHLYTGFTPNFVKGMRNLCATNADVITPNMTEALLMLEEPYCEGPYTSEYITDIIKKLASLGKMRIVLTGVYFDGERYGAAAYDGSDSGGIGNGVHFAMAKRVPGMYHGTGDLFASVLTAALTKGNTLQHATDIAVKFAAESITRTFEAGTEARYGVNFEAGLGELAGLI